MNEDQFILDNYREMTMVELAKVLNISQGRVYNICVRLGIKPISIKDKTIKFIQQHLDLSFNQMAVALDISISTLDGNFRKFEWPRIAVSDRDKPLQELIGHLDIWPKEPEQQKANSQHLEAARVHNVIAARYKNNITLEDIAGSNTGPTWSSF